MADEYTPRLEVVRAHYATGVLHTHPGISEVEAHAEFDRMLEEVRRAAGETAFDESGAPGLNPYRKEFK